MEAASEADRLLTARLVVDPAFHGGDTEGLDAAAAYTAQARLGARDWRVNVVAVPCAPELASGRVALCMHGHGHCCCVSAWGRFWAPMLRMGYHVLAFDAPGFGRSSGASGRTVELSCQVAARSGARSGGQSDLALGAGHAPRRRRAFDAVICRSPTKCGAAPRLGPEPR